MKIQKFINKKPYLIAGPCSAETEQQLMLTAKHLKEIVNVFRAGVWKPRTNPGSFEGVGEIGLNWLQKVKKEVGLKVATEVANAKHVECCLKAEIDVLWIGARTTVNPFYVQEIADALIGVNIPVFVKNPIHPELGLWLGALERLFKAGITQLATIHRGFYLNEVSAFRNDPKWEMPIKLREELPHIPIICDPSHIAGDCEMIQNISQTAMDLNMDGLMIETHQNPEKAWSDSKQQINSEKLKQIMSSLVLRKSKTDDVFLNHQLREFRDKINILDRKIVSVLSDRKKIVEEIAHFKQQNKITIFQIERWFEILRYRKNDANDFKMDEKIIADIFELIHKYSILTQTQIMQDANGEKLEN